MLRKCIGGAILAASLLGVACSGDGPVTGTGTPVVPSLNQVVVTEPAPIARDGHPVDTLELEGFDAGGNLIFGPFFVPFSTTMVFDVGEIPAAVQTLELDYLRHGGFALFRAFIPRNADGSFNLNNPGEQAVELHDTAFEIQGNSVNVTFLGHEFGPVRGAQNKVQANVRFKGMCYSPAPINFRNVDAPSIGDLFWDRVGNQENWFALWGSGPLQMSDNADKNARGDVNDMRAMGINLIRTYCMVSRQLFVVENNEFKAGVIPVPPDKFAHFTHKQFLDHCWNNGNQPIYVLVGIPLPSTVLYRYGNATDAERAYWDFIVEEIVRDTHDHPAVLGYTLFNEIDENRSAWPGVNEIKLTGGVQNEDSDFYYGQLLKYSKKIHDITGRGANQRKLVGWAAHDNQPFVHYGGSVPAANPYFAQLEDIDFYGVNTYQSLSLDSVLGSANGQYGSLTGKAKKPVILTELGWPGVGTSNPANLDSLVDNEVTQKKAAAVITDMIPKAFASDLVLGLCYFEYSDEWWKQPPFDATAWNGGPPDPGMPNGYHSQEAFGLYATARAGGRKNNDSVYDGAKNRVVLPVDSYIPRQPMIDALKAAYANVK